MGVPVIFIFGGPGSGKTTHAQNLADIYEGYRHINMNFTITEHVKENQGVVPSVVLALLAREINSTPRCRGYLISGYPRHIEDFQLYSEKLGKIDGAILMDSQDSYPVDDSDAEGRISQVVTEAARKELQDFQSRVLPVCEHLDNQGLLYVISGERPHELVFRDIQKAHSRITRQSTLCSSPSASNESCYDNNSMLPFATLRPSSTTFVSSPKTEAPRVIFIMGGPGSRKATLVKDMLYLYPGWSYVSIGEVLRKLVERCREESSLVLEYPKEKLEMIENLMQKGELIPQDIVIQVLTDEVEKLQESEGIIVVGFPRDVIQAHNFEEKFGQIAPLLLIDCSELELGRNLGRRESRLDDTVAAAHRRLCIYREVTLPMLKAFDEKHRLRLIDGDADGEQVVKELKRAIYVETQMFSKRSAKEEEDIESTPDIVEYGDENGVEEDIEMDIRSFSNEGSDNLKRMSIRE